MILTFRCKTTERASVSRLVFWYSCNIMEPVPKEHQCWRTRSCSPMDRILAFINKTSETSCRTGFNERKVDGENVFILISHYLYRKLWLRVICFHGFVSISVVRGATHRDDSEWLKQQPMTSKQKHENKSYKVIIIINILNKINLLLKSWIKQYS